MKEIPQEVIEGVLKKNKKDCRLLFDTYKDFVWALVFRTAGTDRDTAEDIFQEVFITLFRKISHYSRRAQLSTWIYRITYNKIMDITRKEQRRRTREMFQLKEHAAASENEYRSGDVIQQLLAPLSPFERYIITARELEGISFEELAEITGKRSGALRTAIHRIKEKIRKEASHDIHF
ncbi:MAG: RNA polymerase sigma factor [Fibrobacterota bacterium]